MLFQKRTQNKANWNEVRKKEKKRKNEPNLFFIEKKAAGLNAARCFLSTDNNEIKQMFKKNGKFEMSVVNALVEEEFNTKARGKQ